MESSSSERGNIFKRYPKITISIFCILTMVVLDVTLTNAYYGLVNDEEREDADTKIRIKHAVYHHTFKELTKETESEYSLYTNSLGFKDASLREIDLESTNHRILFIGDSFTEGVTLNYEDTFVGIIDSTFIDKKIEVLNAGRASYSPIIYWRKIKHLIEVDRLMFDELVVYIDIADPHDEKKYYQLSDEMNVISRNYSQPPQPTEAELEVMERGERIVKLKKTIKRHTTVIYTVLNFLYDASMEKPKKQKILEKETASWSFYLSSNYVRDKWTIDDNLYESFGKDGVLIMKKYMDKLVELLKENNIKLTIAVYPYPSQVWYEDLHSRHVHVWEEWAIENDVNFINHFPDFVVIDQDNNKKLETLKKYYIPNDVHFNKEGNKVIANKFIQTYFNKE
jgi:hypothetical protein